jgi:predicted nucleic acid-binding protein
LVDAWQRGRAQVVVSSHILTELERTLGNAYVVARLDEQRRNAFLALVGATTTLASITTPIPTIASTHADNLVLATAKSAGVLYLVTGDMELLRLGRDKDATIVSPRQFYERLEAEPPDERRGSPARM